MVDQRALKKNDHEWDGGVVEMGSDEVNQPCNRTGRKRQSTQISGS